MKKDYYSDMIMGEWKPNKKTTTKESMSFDRRAEVKLHKDYAVEWIDPTDFKKYRVFGDVVLTETKLVNMKTSEQSFFRGVELTKTSEKTLVF